MKYIYYKRTRIGTGAIISNSNVPPNGFTLYAEVECPKFEDIVRSDGSTIIGVDGITNSSAQSIVEIFVWQSLHDIDFETIPYKMTIHHNGHVMMYFKNLVL